jgi:hypothetical protein
MTFWKPAMALAASAVLAGCEAGPAASRAETALAPSFAAQPERPRATRLPAQLTEWDIVQAVQSSL